MLITSGGGFLRTNGGITISSSGGGSSPGGFPDATISTDGAGWVTMGFAAPEGAIPSGDAIQIGALTTQSDIKRTWNDGSAKFLVATAYASGAGSHAITKITNPGGTAYTPTWPSASVTFDIGGTVYTAALPSYSGTDSWLSGPVVREARVLVTPVTGGSTPHVSLRVRFDVRSFAAGGHRVDIALENGLNVAGTDTVTYDLAVTVAGSSVYTESGVVHASYQRARLTYWTSASEATWTPDAQPFIDAKALPSWESGVSSSSWTISGAGYGLFEESGLTLPMTQTGGRAELGFRPDWVAQAMVHGTANQWATVRHRGGNPCGYWQVHITESDGTSLISLSTKTDFWFDPSKRYASADGTSGPANDMSGVFTNGVGDPAHYPSLAFAPYLIWGDRWFADEVKFQANYHLLRAHYNRDGASALYVHDNQERGIAWVTRDLVDACGWLPLDSHLTYMTTALGNNLTELDAIEATSVDPLGGMGDSMMWMSSHQDNYSPWMQYYLCWALDHAHRNGFTGGETALSSMLTYWSLLWLEPTFGEGVSNYEIWARETPSGTYFTTRAALAAYNTGLATFSTTTYFVETYAMAKLCAAYGVDSTWKAAMDAHGTKASAVSSYPRFSVAATSVGV